MPEPTETPISPPIQTSSTSTNPSASIDTISPVTRHSTFEHKTSGNVAPAIPEIDTSIQSVNATPVELDGIPTSPEDLEGKKGNVVSPSLGEEDRIEAEFLGDGVGRGASAEIKEKRAAALEKRSKDPGVIVNLPDAPTAEEVEAAKSADGTTTPAVNDEGKR